MKLGYALVVMVFWTGIAQAATLGEEDRMVINRINATDFEVVEGINFGAAEYWCGAATFVERRSKMSALTEIYVKRPLGPSQTASGVKAVVFTTDASGLPASKERVTLTVKEPGTMLKSVRARQYCRDAFTRSTK